MKMPYPQVPFVPSVRCDAAPYVRSTAQRGAIWYWHVVHFALAVPESLPATLLWPTLEVAGARVIGCPPTSQEVASEVEERPAMHVVQFALA